MIARNSAAKTEKHKKKKERCVERRGEEREGNEYITEEREICI